MEGGLEAICAATLFWVSAAMILLVTVVVIAPGLFTDLDPNKADLSKSLDGPRAGHSFGYDKQGYDVFARTVYGARASVAGRSARHDR